MAVYLVSTLSDSYGTHQEFGHTQLVVLLPCLLPIQPITTITIISNNIIYYRLYPFMCYHAP